MHCDWAVNLPENPKVSDMKNIMIKMIPYEKFKKDGIKSFLNDLQKDTIILIDAKLNPEEEALIIKETMEEVSSRFKGIELGSLDLSSGDKTTPFEKIRNSIIETIIGKKRGFTIIGPAKIVRKIKRDPEDLLLYM